MSNKYDLGDKREKAISACLDQFVNKGLYETTSRDLSKALKLQSGGMYSYFSTKDEAVLMCAEEAAFLLEKYLITPTINEIREPEAMTTKLLDRANKLSPMMRFFAQVCSVAKYREGIEPALKRLCERYKKYAVQFAEQLNCKPEEIEPYFYMCVTAISNYMIFGESEYVLPQIALIKEMIKSRIEQGE